MHSISQAMLGLFGPVMLAAYLCGCINGAILVSKAVFHNDVRAHGSGNAGLTNFYRTFGAKYAPLVLLVDMGKAALAVGFALLYLRIREAAGLEETAKYLAGLFCVIGHMYPVTSKFRGGKGILCSGTLLLFLDWRIALVCWGLFLVLWLTTRYVSLGSVSAALILPMMTHLVYGRPVLDVLAAAIALLVIIAHRENIVRLLHGRESKFHFHVNPPKDEKE